MSLCSGPLVGRERDGITHVRRARTRSKAASPAEIHTGVTGRHGHTGDGGNAFRVPRLHPKPAASAGVNASIVDSQTAFHIRSVCPTRNVCAWSPREIFVDKPRRCAREGRLIAAQPIAAELHRGIHEIGRSGPVARLVAGVPRPRTRTRTGRHRHSGRSHDRVRWHSWTGIGCHICFGEHDYADIRRERTHRDRKSVV